MTDNIAIEDSLIAANSEKVSSISIDDVAKAREENKQLYLELKNFEAAYGINAVDKKLINGADGTIHDMKYCFGTKSDRSGDVVFHLFQSLKKPNDTLDLSDYWYLQRGGLDSLSNIDYDFVYLVSKTVFNDRNVPLRFCLNFEIKTVRRSGYYGYSYNRTVPAPTATMVWLDKNLSGKEVMSSFKEIKDFLDEAAKLGTSKTGNHKFGLEFFDSKIKIDDSEKSVKIHNEVFVEYLTSTYSREHCLRSDHYLDMKIFDEHFKQKDVLHFNDGFIKPVETLINKFQNKKSSIKNKIAKNDLKIKAFQAGTEVSAIIEERKKAREEKTTERVGIKLGKEFENFTKLALLLSKMKDTIEEIEGEMAKESIENLDFTYMANKLHKIDLGYSYLKSLLKK